MNSGGAKPKSRTRKRLTKGQKAYMEKLRDPRWQKRKAEVIERDGYQCTRCPAGLNDGRNLQVHHGYYSREFEFPWEYPIESLFTLCEKCHPQAEIVRAQVYEALGKLHGKYQHHIYYLLLEFIEELAAGKSFEALDVPWALGGAGPDN